MKSLFWPGMLTCMGLAVGIPLLMHHKVIAPPLGLGLGVAVIAGVTVLNIAHTNALQREDRKRRAAAGFETDAMAGLKYRWTHRTFAACQPFPGVQAVRLHLQCCYWLPSHPHIRVYDCWRKGVHPVGHIVERPTAAPAGVAAHGLSEKEVIEWAGDRGPLTTLPTGVICSEARSGSDGLTRWLPMYPGVLVVEDGYARWFSPYRLEIRDIRGVVEQMKVMPK